jgi:hypothetical protein
MTVDLRKILEELIGGYSEDAPSDAVYPYKVFSLRKLTEDSGISQYNLEVNVWDQHEYYSRAETIMDKLEKKLNKQTFLGEKMLIYTYNGQRENVEDTDKSIKRVREQFEMRVVEREE